MRPMLPPDPSIENSASADPAPRKPPLLGLHVIEAWCWLWAAVWALFSLFWIGTIYDMYSHAAFPDKSRDLHVMLYAMIFRISLLGIVGMAASVASVQAAVGVRRRRNRARYFTLALGSLGIFTLPFSIFALGMDAAESVGTPRMIVFLSGIVALLLFPPWMIYYLGRPEVKAAFGLNTQKSDQRQKADES